MSILAGRSQQERLWILVGGLGAAVLVLIGWLFFISPQRSSTSDVNSQIVSVQDQNLALENRITGLQKQSSNMNWYRKQLAAANAALPSTSGIPTFLRSLQKLGAATNTDAVNVTVGAPTDLSAVTSPTVATPTDTTSTAPAATSTPTDATSTGPTTSPASGVYGLPITAQVTGSNTALNRFLQQLQSVQPRAVLITELTEGAGTSGTAGSSVTGNSLQLTMEAFVAPSGMQESAALASAAGSN